MKKLQSATYFFFLIWSRYIRIFFCSITGLFYSTISRFVERQSQARIGTPPEKDQKRRQNLFHQKLGFESTNGKRYNNGFVEQNDSGGGRSKNQFKYDLFH